MNKTGFIEKLPSPMRRRPVLAALSIVILVGVVLIVALRPSKSDATLTATHQVRRGDFTVTIVEGGTLSAVSEVAVRNEVEGTARIVYIVPEGNYVKKGDLLVELDSSQAQDQVNQQEINLEKAKFAVEQAEAQLEIARSATNSDYLTAKLKLELSKIDLRKYDEGQSLVNMIEASNKVVQVKAQLAVNEDTYRNSTNLAAKGYETKQKVESDWLSVLNTRNSLIVATNGVWMLENFDMEKQRKQFESEVLQSDQELRRVISQNRRRMSQYEADLITQSNTMYLSIQKLDRDKRNLVATKIYAPQDGLVVYQISENRFSSESLIEGGAVVRNRQELIKLPDLSRMKVIVKIHESHINLMRPGLPAYVTLDSMPDVRFAGTVEKVAPLPDTQARWGNPNLKVYNTDIHLSEAIPNIRPGVSAKAEIIITNIPNAISVPIQAITSLKGKQVAYVVTGNKTEPRPVTPGMYNTKFIEVANGLKEGERVLLAPPFDTQERELDDSILPADEKARIAATNAPVRPGLDQRPMETTQVAPPGNGPLLGGPGNPAQLEANGLAARNGGQQPSQGPGGQRGPGGFNREEMLKQYDKDGDGQLDETEREAMRTALMARFGAQGGPGGQGGPGAPGGRGAGFNREEMMKQFDKNGDGQIDDTEREAMRASFGNRPRGGGGEPGAPGARGDGERRPGGEGRQRGDRSGAEGGQRGTEAERPAGPTL